jgi:hypothetical protein
MTLLLRASTRRQHFYSTDAHGQVRFKIALFHYFQVPNFSGGGVKVHHVVILAN